MPEQEEITTAAAQTSSTEKIFLSIVFHCQLLKPEQSYHFFSVLFHIHKFGVCADPGYMCNAVSNLRVGIRCLPARCRTPA
ncbi:hypothetical protein HMPREF1554_00176 [Porphyromonas gingivalis F0569]|uniref:Uncharacterized protein n=1 Tax=Porphyromonas gingivalis F0570 TaxID=1227271 RepID=A0A0E2M4M6_PORGN|nr:hypothetical protein HMPREF1555_01444 [Porphyromonas gingivalis F0570]ERJ68926.1 hypothetical protein HMPREF1553_00825 [Porphyromonas gingivalis F0568]ERJ71426.1 hypothetical protein HMPREF1554_00176 [Porphyromonas gingivalis F0569]